MKSTLSLPVLIAVSFVILFSGCTKDKCSTTYTYQVYEPVYMDYATLRGSVASEAARQLETPGKIYLYGGYLFVNEVNKGVHVIDNSNPAAPVNKAFINIPGNVDMAVRGNILYADSYVDLVAINISNPEAAVEVRRLENLFPQRIWDLGYYYGDPEKGIIVSWNLSDKTETMDVPCGEEPQQYYYYGRWEGDMMIPSISTANSGGAQSINTNQPSGQGGSMARFTIASNYLYCIDNTDMNLVDITTPASPVIWTKQAIGFNIETIFPYGDKLFIGSRNGMYIYDNSNPSAPTQISVYQHITSCDPVVIEGNYAYVTLRSGTTCQGFTDALEVIDISNLTNPVMVKQYPMFNPHGLGIDDGKLFICDGDAGLKIFDATDPMTINEHLLKHYGTVQAYDVIPVNSTNDILIMIGADGLYQYDYNDINDIHLISSILVI